MQFTITTKRTRTSKSSKSLTFRYQESFWFMLKFSPFSIRVDYKPFVIRDEARLIPAYSDTLTDRGLLIP